MVGNLISWLALAAVGVFLVWLATRAWRARRWFVRWPGLVLSGLLALLVLVFLVIGAVGMVKLYSPQASISQEVKVEVTPERVARGEHLANVFCSSCHSTTGEMPLTGGVDIGKDIPMPIGTFVSVNLTPAGPLKNYSDTDIWRVLREGIAPGGRRLLVMGTTYTRFLSDEDMMSLIAYLRSQQPVENPIPNVGDRPNYLGVLLTGIGIFPDLPKVTEAIVAPPKAATVEYGKYILSYQDCRSCHGNNLLGGDNPIGPKGPGLRTVRGMSQDEFIAMMRSGLRPNGLALNPPMPWKAIGRMDDVELSAMYQYLIAIP